MRYLLVLGFLLAWGSPDTMARPAMEPDSAKYKWIKGEKYLLHKVRSRETWNSIARKHQMSISDVMRSNMGVIDLKAGQILNIPSKLINSRPKDDDGDNKSGQQTPAKKGNPVYYTVQSGETLYGISKKFSTSITHLKEWNELPGDIVRKGQKIIVGHSGDVAGTAGATPSPGPDATSPDEPATAATVDTLAVAYTREVTPMGKDRGGKKLSKVSETGICSWISDGSVNQSKFYALHRTAPSGTIIKVTNKMNEQHVFVKVVGVLPDTGDNGNSIIKISETAVRKLGALDKQFQVELTYGITN